MRQRKLVASAAALTVMLAAPLLGPATAAAATGNSVTPVVHEQERAAGEVVLNVDYQVQETGYWCGPAAVRIALSARGIYRSQADLAAELDAFGIDDRMRIHLAGRASPPGRRRPRAGDRRVQHLRPRPRRRAPARPASPRRRRFSRATGPSAGRWNACSARRPPPPASWPGPRNGRRSGPPTSR